MELRKLSQLLYQIKIISQEGTALFEKETGFSLTRYEILMFLQKNGECLQNKLQSDLKIDLAAISRHLKILEQKGYVIRKRNENNNREVFVSLSDKAVNELTECEKNHQESDDSLCVSLSDEEIDQLTQLLDKLY
ncbi:MarR family winged helix-turn-helix transcriptional regulator [Enterococcus mundtii]|uniref:MarR family winged helix-turn-helix transcriptional regulator n=1 Tax=Enterococcus TaxID=1350 RepID=UPI0004457732|nr:MULTISPECIES: MarR family winged helix-turn-helix transcriptional regulator [Enterococcus]AZP93129.1 MarR family transcriptional regulator [Enterococcus mundtii]EYT96482.1 MarR family transcriptional regulator [Enterococcus mundtii CRL35]MDA9428676.1 transcriptional regulator, MarR family [Enterococcus mundtii 1A]MDK4210630.1 MarR family winged helix-turn-helix transcriptional regulator [Enterococcus mundtii]MDO7878114.1 MarR family winged helix-turn-helix transcriptional regulator [Enteroc